MANEAIQLFMEDFISKNPKALFTYYARRRVNVKDLITCFPTYASRRADVVIWFELYTTDPKLVKDKYNVMGQTIEDWNKYIESISQ